MVLASSACAAKHDGFVQRFVKPGEPPVSLGPEVAGPSQQSLQDYSRKLRALQTKATSKSTLLPTIEGSNPTLANALLRLTFVESAENHRLVAAAYRKAGVADYAYRHYQLATRLEPCDSSAHEGLAQIWRDWGMPDVALGDAYRALHCRPDSAAAHNTLGTVFQALGQTKNARRAFERALELDAGATFALNNLCYLSLQEGKGREAQQTCQRALAQEPQEPMLTAARANLALAFAIQGDVPRAERQLLENPDSVAGHYNVGMLRMSLGQYSGAAQAFDAATAERPSAWEARRRAAQARARTVAKKEP
jgi:Flp pilus assembly protein TadD